MSFIDELDKIDAQKGTAPKTSIYDELDEIDQKAKSTSSPFVRPVVDAGKAALAGGVDILAAVPEVFNLATADKVTPTVNLAKMMHGAADALYRSQSPEALAQIAAVEQAIADTDKSALDLPALFRQNPLALLSVASRSAPSALAAVGSGGASVAAAKVAPSMVRAVAPKLMGAGVVSSRQAAQALRLAEAAKANPAAVATAGAGASNVGLNMADTWRDTEGADPSGRYLGTGVAGLGTLAGWKLLDGGVEGLLARKIAGEAAGKPGASALRNVFTQAAKGAGKEAAQEGIFEQPSQDIGAMLAKGDGIDFNRIAKNATLAGTTAALVGGVGGAAAGRMNTPAQDVQDTIRAALQQNQQPAPESSEARPAREQSAQQSPAPSDDDGTALAEKIHAIAEKARKIKEEAQAQTQAQAPAQAAAQQTPTPAQTQQQAPAAEPQGKAPEAAEGTAPAPQAVAPAQEQQGQAQARADKFNDVPNLPERVDPSVLQNRNREQQASVKQMLTIANNPDYARTGYSRDFANGAPVVAFGNIAEEQRGNEGYAVTAKGERIPVQYAVVEADSVATSNNINGAANPDYGLTANVNAIAGNGRVTGIAAAYRAGKAGKYRQELTADAAMHGVNPDVIRGMKAPILVRIMPNSRVKPGIADESNTASNQQLNAVEQAQNDASRVDLDSLTFNEDGSPSAESVRQFVRGMPETERAGMVDATGNPATQAVDRLSNAIFNKAYKSDALTAMYAQATNPEARLVINALVRLAPKMARLDGAGDRDFRGALVDAVNAIVQGKRQGLKMSEIAQQVDALADPDTQLFIQLFARNPRSTKEAVRILSDVADCVYSHVQEEQNPTGDMFGGARPITRADVMGRVRNELNKGTEQAAENGGVLQDGNGGGSAEEDASGRNTGTDRRTADAGRDAGVQGGREVATEERPAEPVSRQEPAEPETEAQAEPASAQPPAYADGVYADKAEALFRDIEAAGKALGDTRHKLVAELREKARESTPKLRLALANLNTLFSPELSYLYLTETGKVKPGSKEMQDFLANHRYEDETDFRNAMQALVDKHGGYGAKAWPKWRAERVDSIARRKSEEEAGEAGKENQRIGGEEQEQTKSKEEFDEFVTGLKTIPGFNGKKAQALARALERASKALGTTDYARLKKLANEALNPSLMESPEYVYLYLTDTGLVAPDSQEMQDALRTRGRGNERLQDLSQALKALADKHEGLGTKAWQDWQKRRIGAIFRSAPGAAEQASEGFGLEGQTEAEAQAEAARLEDVAREEEREKKEVEEKARKERIAKEEKQAADRAVDSFSLTDDTVSAEDAVSGQSQLLFSKSGDQDTFTPDDALTDKAVEHFGLTRNPREAGYILPDGRMLDFSGRHWGLDDRSARGRRSVDHREVSEVMDDELDDNSEYMYRFMGRTGAVRVDVGAGVASAARPVTVAQSRVLANAFRGEDISLSYTTPEGRIVTDTDIEGATSQKISAFWKDAQAQAERGEINGAYASRGKAKGAGQKATISRRLSEDAELGDAYKLLSGAGRVEVVEHVSDLPADVRRKLAGTDNAITDDEGKVQGLFDPSTGKAYLVAENLTEDRARGVFLHEVGIHMAADRRFRRDMQPVLKRALQLVNNGAANGDPVALAVKKRMSDAGETSAEETAAYLVEEIANRQGKVSNPIKRWWDALRSRLEAWLMRHGFRNVDDLSMQDIADIAAANVRALAREVRKGTEPGLSQIAGAVRARMDGGNNDAVALAASVQRKNSPWYAIVTKDELGNTQFEPGRRAYSFVSDKARQIFNMVDDAFHNEFQLGLPKPGLRKKMREFRAYKANAQRDILDMGKMMSGWTKEERELLSDVIEKEVKPGVNPPSRVLKVAGAVNELMEQLSDAAVACGVLPEESADRWRGHYLPRIYLQGLKNVEGADAETIKSQSEAAAQYRREVYRELFGRSHPVPTISGKHFKGRGIFKALMTEREVSDYVAEGWEVRDPNWEWKEGRLEWKGEAEQKELFADRPEELIAEKGVTVWRDFLPDERALMGEERDALTRIVLGTMSIGNDIARARLFQELANDPEYSRAAPDEDNGFVVPVPDEKIKDTGGLKRFGALSGRYVTREVWSELQNQAKESSLLGNLWRTFMSYWKENVTVLNPVSHMYNTIGNFTTAHLAGLSYWDGHKYVATIREFMKGEEGSQFLREAREHGLFSGSWTKEEVAEILPDETLRKVLNSSRPALERLLDLFQNVASYGLRSHLRKAYEFEDSFFKLAIYMDARKQGLSPEDAVDYALQYVFAYDDLPTGARKIRDIALGLPFFSWHYKFIPLLVRTAMVHPLRAMAPLSLVMGHTTMTYMLLAGALSGGGDDDDMKTKALRALLLCRYEQANLPDYLKASVFPKVLRLFRESTTGDVFFLDISRWIPGITYQDFENQMGGIGIPQDLAPNSPVLSALMSLYANKDPFTGKELVNNLTDTEEEKLQRRAMYVMKTLTPAISPLGYHFTRVANAISYEADAGILKDVPYAQELHDFLADTFNLTGRLRDNTPVQLSDALLNSVLGVKIRRVNFDQQERNKQIEENRAKKSLRSDLARLKRQVNDGAASEAFYEKERDKVQEKMEALKDAREKRLEEKAQYDEALAKSRSNR